MEKELIQEKYFAVGRFGKKTGVFNNMKIYFNLGVLFCCLLFISESGFTQQKSDKNLQIKIQPKGCERNNVILEQAHQDAENSIIILIGRPGIKDKKAGITEKRLFTSQAYLINYLKLRTNSTLITSQSINNDNEYGVIEIYVKGILFDTLASYPDKELGLGSCDSLESDDEESRAKRTLLYPWLYKNTKKLKFIKNQ